MTIKLYTNIRLAFMALILSFHATTYSQQIVNCDLKFINHLTKKSNYEEALFLLNSAGCSSIQTNDSANFLRGWCLYSLGRYDQSAVTLIKITPAASFYLKSHFYASYNFNLSGKPDKALETLDNIYTESPYFISLKKFEITGTELLKGDINAFDEWFKNTEQKEPSILESAGNLLDLSSNIKNHKRKSPLLAGIMSGIIPGSGKLYAGRKGEAFSTFLSTAGLGLVTWENYRKNGLNNFMTIAFGAAFAVSYAANIYGSVFTVRISETAYKENVKSTILFNLHIPIRNSFSE